MSVYILDTDILSLLQRGHPKVLAQVTAHPQQSIAITVISVDEQLSGYGMHFCGKQSKMHRSPKHTEDLRRAPGPFPN
jgi:predicted nucleic acid-binding protein